MTHRLWVLNEDFGAAHLVLVCVHVYRTQEMQDPLLFTSTPIWVRFRSEDGIPENTHTWGDPSFSEHTTYTQHLPYTLCHV